MLTLQEMIKINTWLEKHFIGTYFVSFIEGFTETYIIVEKEKNKRKGMQIFSARDILSQEN